MGREGRKERGRKGGREGREGGGREREGGGREREGERVRGGRDGSEGEGREGGRGQRRTTTVRTFIYTKISHRFIALYTWIDIHQKLLL